MPLLALTAVALVAAFVAIVLFTVRTSLVSSDVYADALARARANPEVVARLGEPIESGFMPSGSISTSTDAGGSGVADLTISLSGPRGSGRINAAAERRRGVWIYKDLVFMPPRGADGMIPLAAAGTPVPAAQDPTPAAP